jgi:N-methylhydantoinase A/oxoprolinase/acetone carboxylase beta subunit
VGIGQAVDAAIAAAGVGAADVALVSLSTTLATNALVEGQGARVALVFIGFDDADLGRSGLTEALKGDPVVKLPGGHTHAGAEVTALDLDLLELLIRELGDEVSSFAVASQFATRNPAHEIAARDLIRRVTGRPVTCSHELSANLNGPKRALTAVLNARLIGMIDRLVAACERHLVQVGIDAPLMVVRGDGALISAAMVRERPIETILSGPAASIVGARWLTGASDALVSDIGGTTTDVALLRGGLPEIDPEGARVGGFRTMVEAVAMRTTGLGGDSEVHLVTEGLTGGLRLGPRRLMPVSLLAVITGRWFMPRLTAGCQRCGGRDGRPFRRADDRPARRAERPRTGGAGPDHPTDDHGRALTSRLEVAALERLVARGLVMIAGVTPSDAAHVLGRLDELGRAAAEKALRLIAKRRTGAGNASPRGRRSLRRPWWTS